MGAGCTSPARFAGPGTLVAGLTLRLARFAAFETVVVDVERDEAAGALALGCFVWDTIARLTYNATLAIC